MKQKYQLLKNDDQTRLIIKELSEADPGVFVLTCEEKIDIAVLEAANQEGPESLAAVLRTPNMFLPTAFLSQLAEGAAAVLGGEASAEFFFNDLDMLDKGKPVEEEPAEETEEAVEIDELLGDDSEEDAGAEEEADPLLKGGAEGDDPAISTILGGKGEKPEE